MTVNGSFVAEVLWAAVVVACGTALIAGIRHVLAARRLQPPGGSGRAPGGLVTGVDNRRSTSKTIAVSWTLVLAWMVVALGFIAAEASGATFAGLLRNASDLYLVLLGGPFAAAVLAKVTTRANIGQGRLTKPPAPAPSAFDVVSDDDGNADVYDFQYTLFNLIAIIIVIFTFAGHPGRGLPAIPDFLAVLTGGSALTYTVNKAMATSGPQILSVLPSQARIGDVLTITGSKLAAQATAAGLPAVTVGGVPAANVAMAPGTANTLTATVAAPPPGQALPGGPVQVVVTAADGTVATLNNAVTIVPDAPAIARVEPAPVQAGALLTVSGHWLLQPGSPAGSAPPGTASVGGATPALATADGLACDVTCEGPYSNTLLTLRVGAMAVSGQQQATLTITRGALTATKTVDVRA